MRFNIVITDNETGETLINENTNCINGAICSGDGKARGFNYCVGSAVNVAATIKASEEIGLECCVNNPKVAVAVLLGDCEEVAEKAEKDGAENE